MVMAAGLAPLLITKQYIAKSGQGPVRIVYYLNTKNECTNFETKECYCRTGGTGCTMFIPGFTAAQQVYNDKDCTMALFDE